MARINEYLPPPRVLLHSEQSNDRLSVTERTMPAGAPRPPLHTDGFGLTE